MIRGAKLAVMAAMVFWSAGNLIVRDTELSGPQVAFWRYVIGTGIFVLIHLATVGPLRWRDARIAAPTGIAIAVEIALFFAAIQQTTVANTTMIGSLLPVLLFWIAARRFSERISSPMILATMIAVAGTVLVVLGSSATAIWSPRGDLLAVGALGFFALYFVFGKTARQCLSTFTLQTHSLIVGVPVLAILTVVDTGTIAAPQGNQWIYPLALLALPNTGHLLLNWAHAHVSLTFASMMTLSVPVMSVVGAWIFFGETVGAVQVAGIALVLAVLVFAIMETARLERQRPSSEPT